MTIRICRYAYAQASGSHHLAVQAPESPWCCQWHRWAPLRTGCEHLFNQLSNMHAKSSFTGLFLTVLRLKLDEPNTVRNAFTLLSGSGLPYPLVLRQALVRCTCGFTQISCQGCASSRCQDAPSSWPRVYFPQCLALNTTTLGHPQPGAVWTKH